MTSEMTEIRQGIQQLFKKLSSDKVLPDNWDAELPLSCVLQVADNAELIITKCLSSLFAVSLVSSKTQHITSAVIPDFSDDNVAKCLAELKRDNSRVPLPDKQSMPNLQSSTNSTNFANPATGVNLDPAPSASARFSDPNAPPGFEDEHCLLHPQPSGAHIAFDPDQDIYPPGGRYPTLGPQAPFGPSRGSGGGMHPEPFGSNSHPFIRYDPTSPFQ